MFSLVSLVSVIVFFFKLVPKLIIITPVILVCDILTFHNFLKSVHEIWRVFHHTFEGLFDITDFIYMLVCEDLFNVRYSIYNFKFLFFTKL